MTFAEFTSYLSWLLTNINSFLQTAPVSYLTYGLLSLIVVKAFISLLHIWRY